jgi:hypothetical protein
VPVVRISCLLDLRCGRSAGDPTAANSNLVIRALTMGIALD